jgi:hypothetical protein
MRHSMRGGLHVRAVRWAIQHHKAVPGLEELRRNEVRFCLHLLLPPLIIFGSSCHKNFGSWIVGSCTCLVKHDRT